MVSDEKSDVNIVFYSCISKVFLNSSLLLSRKKKNASFFFIIIFKDFICLFLERGEMRKRNQYERETSIVIVWFFFWKFDMVCPGIGWLLFFRFSFAWYSLNHMDAWFSVCHMTLVWGNSQSLLLWILLPFFPPFFSLWCSHYSYVLTKASQGKRTSKIHTYRQTDRQTYIQKDLLWGIDSHDYGGWEVPWFSVCKMEIRES